MVNISVCFAVYNNSSSLRELYSRSVTTISEKFPSEMFELVFVNDGSTDSSAGILDDLARNDPRVRVIHFSRNFGQMAAIVAGWDHSAGDCSINLAADLQDPPEIIAEMVAAWKSGSTVVVCHRKNHDTSPLRKLTSKLFYKLLLPNVPPGGFDVALLGKEALNVIKGLRFRNRFYQYDILWTGFRTTFIPYDKVKRTHGSSAYTFIRRFENFFSGFLNVSYLPLRVFGLLGIIIAVCSCLYSLSVAWAVYYWKTPFQGWAPLILLILFFGGMNMAMLGFLGEYVWRILDEVKGRPIYIKKSHEPGSQKTHS